MDWNNTQVTTQNTNNIEFVWGSFFENICSKTGKAKVTATLLQDLLGHKAGETLELVIDDDETTDVEDYFITVAWEDVNNYLKANNLEEINSIITDVKFVMAVE